MTRTLPAALRALLLLVLAGALVLWPRLRPSPAGAAGGVVRLDGDAGEDADALAAALLADAAPRLVVRPSPTAPTAAETELLDAAAGRSPLLVGLPDAGPRLAVDPPVRPRTERAAALSVRLRGAPGDTVLVRLVEEGEATDSTGVAVGGAGEGRAAFRVRSPRTGWRTWTVDAGGEVASTGAWVDSAGPPRVWLRAGPPAWESRFAARALEESGAEVRLAQPLGRGLAVGGTARLPETLDDADAVIVLGGAGLSAAERRTLDAFVARGGGVLWAGEAASSPPSPARPSGGARPVRAEALRWRLPAELAALPAGGLTSSLVPLRPSSSASVASWVDGGTAVLALRQAGWGRTGALGLAETWRWRMEAGAVEEHREFWRSLADWLAGGARTSWLVSADAPLATVGVPVRVSVARASSPADGDDADAAEPPRLVVGRPDGSRDTVVVAADPGRPGVHVATVVPATAGVHALALAGPGGDAEPLAAFSASADAPTGGDGDGAPADDAAWARLALAAEESGGGAVALDSVDVVAARLLGGTNEGAGRGLDPRLLLFAAVLGLAGAEWTLRRLRGRA